ncbi:MAG: nucleotidyltransferase family protein [Gammaproteobacteria bacterium]
MTRAGQAIGPDGLTCRDRDIIREVLARYPEVRRVTLFGCRAMGAFGRGSDIDLALEGPGLTTRTLARIAVDLEDSDLPYKVDLLLRDRRLDPKVEEHIRRHGKPFGWEETTLGAVTEWMFGGHHQKTIPHYGTAAFLGFQLKRSRASTCMIPMTM